MSYLVLGNGGGRIRVRGSIIAARQVARELALYSGASVVLGLSAVPGYHVVVQFVRRGRAMVVTVTKNIGKGVRVVE